MRVFIIDNYDSFTYNLYQFIGEICTEADSNGRINHFDVVVKRNDQVTIDEIKTFKPDRIIISPGPGSPVDPEYFGVCASVILELGQTIPILGVCLGMQGIVHVFGGRIIKAKTPMHGKLSLILHNGKTVFKNLPNELDVMRYHSLVAETTSLPECLQVTSIIKQEGVSTFPEEEVMLPEDIEIMGIRHKTLPIYGIQFHPESFASEAGKEMLKNFLFEY